MAIRYRDAIAYGDGTLYVKANLNSSDTKPTTGIATGSIAIETDTGKSFVYDEDSTAWTELKSSGGGGGGGGGSSYTLLESKEYDVSTSSTSASTVDTITIPEAWTSAKILYIKIRDKAGKRNGYYFGSDVFAINNRPADGSTTAWTTFVYAIYCYDNNKISMSQGTGNGVYPDQITSAGAIRIRKKYNSSATLTIDGTFTVEVYTLDWPNNVSPLL